MASTRRAARGLARWVAAPRADAVERVGSNRSGASRAVAGVAHLQDRRREERSPARSRRRSFFSVPDLDAMRERVFSSSKLVRHPPEKLFQVVADVARYEEFVPFCASSRVLRVLTPTRFEAELEIGFKVFSERYVSDVTLEEDPATGEKKVTATAIPPREDDDGLFQRLVSTWRFKPGRAPDETAVAFDLDFKVNSVVHSQVVALDSKPSYAQAWQATLASGDEARKLSLYHGLDRHTREFASVEREGCTGFEPSGVLRQLIGGNGKSPMSKPDAKRYAAEMEAMLRPPPMTSETREGSGATSSTDHSRPLVED